MLNIEEIKQLIVEKLKPLNPYQIILFGSYAYGTPTKDSDLDICIIDKGEISKRERKSKIQNATKPKPQTPTPFHTQQYHQISHHY